MSIDEILNQNKIKENDIRRIISSTYGNFASYQIKKLCCDFYNIQDSKSNIFYDDLNDFYQRCQNEYIIKLERYINIRPPEYTSDQFINNIVLKDDDSINSFIIARVKINQELSSKNYGYIIHKRCNKCETNSPGCNHENRLVASNNTGWKYALFSKKMLKFLIQQKKCTIVHISHVFIYNNSLAHLKYLEKSLLLRQKYISNECVIMSTLTKTFINSLIGILGSRKYHCKPRYRMTTGINKSFNSLGQNYIDYCECIGKIDNVQFFIIKKTPKYNSWHNFYYSQNPIALSLSILLESKLKILHIFHMMDTFFLNSMYKMVCFNTDGFSLVTCSESSNVLDLIKPAKKNYFESYVYNCYFHRDKKDIKSMGKLIINQFSDNENFTFLCFNSKSYVIIFDEDDKKNINKGIPRDISINSLITSEKNCGYYEYRNGENNTIQYRVQKQKDRLETLDYLDSIPYN